MSRKPAGFLHLVRAGAPAFELPGYRVLGELGRGGMATVYLAEQLSLQREVALKVLEPARVGDPSFNERFLREGRIAANLHHRHIVAIHDLGVHGGRAYLAMDYIEQGSVAELAGCLPPAEALRCVREIAGALDLAHRHGIVHRDIKPENILRHPDGAFLLSDFGIARDINASTMTQEGTAVGTPAYMSPEQWRGDRVDGRADLYSLGIVLYQLLTGRVPYGGTDGWAIGMQHMGAPLPQLPAELAVLQSLLNKLLAKRAMERFSSGNELVAAIEAMERSGGVPAATTSTTQLTASVPNWSLSQVAELFTADSTAAAAPTSRGRKALALLALGLLLSGLIAGLFWRGGSRETGAATARSPTTAALGVGSLGGVADVGAVAVLPCVSHAGEDPQLAAYGDALAEELIHRLSRLKSLPVIGRTSSFALRDEGLTAAALGERLGARHVVACSVRQVGEGLRINAELIDAAGNTQRWSGVYAQPTSAALQAVDEIAVEIAERLLSNLVGADRALLLRHSTSDPRALQLYRDSLVAANLWMVDSIAEAKRLAQQSVEIDPQFALGYVALAHAWINDTQMSELHPDEVRGPLLAAIEAALRIDPDLAEAHALRGVAAAMLDFDYAEQSRHLQRAYLLQPNSPIVNQLLCDSYWFRDPCSVHARRARDLDPLNPHLWGYLIASYFHSGRYQHALIEADLTIRQYPDIWIAYWMRSWAKQQLGDCTGAVADAERAYELSEFHIETLGMLPTVYVCAGRRADAEQTLAELQRRRAAGVNVPWSFDSIAFVALGQRDAAFDAAERALAQWDWRMPLFLVSPWWLPLKNDPGYLPLMRKAHVPETLIAATLGLADRSGEAP